MIFYQIQQTGILDHESALVPELSYADLNINQGGNASMAFESLYNETDESITKQTRKDLLEYCKLDTLAMVEILNVLFAE